MRPPTSTYLRCDELLEPLAPLKPPSRTGGYHLFVSIANTGAAELLEEMRAFFAEHVQGDAKLFTSSTDLRLADRMLLYCTAGMWSGDGGTRLLDEVTEALEMGMPLLIAHEGLLLCEPGPKNGCDLSMLMETIPTALHGSRGWDSFVRAIQVSTPLRAGDHRRVSLRMLHERIESSMRPIAASARAGGASTSLPRLLEMPRWRLNPAFRSTLEIADTFPSRTFSDLTTAPNGLLRIPDAVNRAITIEQLHRIMAHVAHRLGYERTEAPLRVRDRYNQTAVINIGKWERTRDGEEWFGRRISGSKSGKVALEDVGRLTLEEVNLHDVLRYVIHPATVDHSCSMVELMATEEQPPDYFVSHCWKEGVLDFLRCLVEHSWRRGLESAYGFHKGRLMGPEHGTGPHPKYLGGRSPRYWVCAHANNQHELGADVSSLALEMTSFYRALHLAKGTVSVIDKTGAYFSRVWCVYEMSLAFPEASVHHRRKSLRRGYSTFDVSAEHTWDAVCTADWVQERRSTEGMRESLRHEAVVLCDGISALSSGSHDRRAFERAFPIAVIDKGVAFACQEAYATEEADKECILRAIGPEGAARLDEVVHGRVAAHSLPIALNHRDRSGGHDKYLDAVKRGHLRALYLSLNGRQADTQETWEEVRAVLDPQATESVTIMTELKELPRSFSFGDGGKHAALAALSSLSLHAPELRWLPRSLLHGCQRLALVTLSGCQALQALPEGLFRDCRDVLTVVDIKGCERLLTVPDGLFHDMDALETVDLSGCRSLQMLPEELFRGCENLVSVDLSLCEGLEPMPSNLFRDCVNLRAVNLRACPGLTAELRKGLLARQVALDRIVEHDLHDARPDTPLLPMRISTAPSGAPPPSRGVTRLSSCTW